MVLFVSNGQVMTGSSYCLGPPDPGICSVKSAGKPFYISHSGVRWPSRATFENSWRNSIAHTHDTFQPSVQCNPKSRTQHNFRTCSSNAWHLFLRLDPSNRYAISFVPSENSSQTDKQTWRVHPLNFQRRLKYREEQFTGNILGFNGDICMRAEAIGQHEGPTIHF